MLNTAILSADPTTSNRVEDNSSTPLADFIATFTSDTEAPFIVSSSVTDGEGFSPAPYDLTEIVTFAEPMNTAFTTASSFDLYGQYRNQHIAAASFGWDPTGTQLTINYNHLSGDTYRLTLFARGFQDLVGHALSSDFTVDFAIFPPHEDTGGAQGCSDGIDNDGDGLTDCADPDCGNTPPCGPVAPMMSPRMIVALIATLSTVGLVALRGARRRSR